MADLRLGLVGAGAVGSLLAVTLAHNGQPVQWVVRNAARRNQLGALRFIAGRLASAVDRSGWQPLDDIGELPPALDWVIVAVKAQQVAEVVQRLGATGGTQLLIVANGLLEEPAHLALLYGGARVDGPRLEATAHSTLVVGALGPIEDRSPELVGLLTAPWLMAGAKEEIEVRMWHKLALNCVVNPLTALLDCLNGELEQAAGSAMLQGLLDEVTAVASAELGERWGYTGQQLAQDLAALISETAGNSSSMREDLRAGRETEIEHMNLAIARLGQRHGVPCPLNQRISDMICLVANRGTL